MWLHATAQVPFGAPAYLKWFQSAGSSLVLEHWSTSSGMTDARVEFSGILPATRSADTLHYNPRRDLFCQPGPASDGRSAVSGITSLDSTLVMSPS
jgi:hypothetical protein